MKYVGACKNDRLRCYYSCRAHIFITHARPTLKSPTARNESKEFPYLAVCNIGNEYDDHEKPERS